MAIAMNDQDNLDVILRLDSTNRDVEIPDDILIASYSNLVDKGRKSFGNPFTNNQKVQGSVANKAHSVVSVIQKALDDARIDLPSTSVAVNYNVLLDEDGTVISARYFGSDPTVVVSGSNDETVTITFPSTCIPISVQVVGPNTSVDGSGNRTVVFNGSGLPGNTSVNDLYSPVVEKASLAISLGNPSTSNPYTLDKDNSPAVQIVGVGTTSSPSISLRFVSISAFSSKHLLKFNW